MEIVELRDHPWFVASQFHPEFKSRPERPHPLFDGFVATASALRDGREPVLRARARRPRPTDAAAGAAATAPAHGAGHRRARAGGGALVSRRSGSAGYVSLVVVGAAAHPAIGRVVALVRGLADRF